jgi:hypothetical protein
MNCWSIYRGISLHAGREALESINTRCFRLLSTVRFFRASARALQSVVVDKVRREKVLDFSGCNSRPGTGS